MLPWPSFMCAYPAACAPPATCAPPAPICAVLAFIRPWSLFVLLQLLFMLTQPSCICIAPALGCAVLAFVCPWPPFVHLLLLVICADLALICVFTLPCSYPGPHLYVCAGPCSCVHIALLSFALPWPSFMCPPCACALLLIHNAFIWPLFMHIWACLSVSNT